MSATALFVLLIYLAGLVLAFRGQPLFALFSYLWIFYNDPQTSWWGRELPGLRYSLIAALVALFAVWFARKSPMANWQSSPPMKALTILAAWVWLQSLWAVNSGAHADGAVLVFKFLVLAYVIFKTTSTETNIEWFLWAHILGCFIFGWKGYMDEAGGRLETVGGPGVDDSNLLAAHLVTGIVVAGMFVVGFKGWRRWAALASLPFTLNGLILTQSRGGFLALIAAGGAAWYLAPRLYRRWVAAAGVLGVILLLTLSNQGFWERISSLTESSGERNTETRLQILGPQLQMFKDHPLGAGHRGNEYLSSRYMPPELLSASGRRSAHNTFMAVLVDQGLPGVLLLLWLYGWAIVTLRHLKKLDLQGLPVRLGVYRAAVGAALASLFVSGLFLNLLKTEVQVWMMALLASLAPLCLRAVATLAKQSDASSDPESTAADGQRAGPSPKGRAPNREGGTPVRQVR